jgi:hypothetical protein
VPGAQLSLCVLNRVASDLQQVQDLEGVKMSRDTRPLVKALPDDELLLVMHLSAGDGVNIKCLHCVCLLICVWCGFVVDASGAHKEVGGIVIKLPSGEPATTRPIFEVSARYCNQL